MGCANSRQKNYSENELIIISVESRMCFSKHGSDKIDIIFKRFSVALKMNITQFTMACNELSLNLPNLQSPDSAVYKFFQLFKDNTQYNQRQLSALGVLLGSGDPRTKARVLFKIYDIVKDNTLDENEIHLMISDITFVALIALPKLAVLSLKDRDQIEDLEKFSRKLISVHETIKNFYEIIILSRHKQRVSVEDVKTEEGEKQKKPKKRRIIQIGIEEFIEKFENEAMKIFCDASLLRHFAIQKYSQVIAPRDMVKDYLLEANSEH